MTRAEVATFLVEKATAPVLSIRAAGLHPLVLFSKTHAEGPREAEADRTPVRTSEGCTFVCSYQGFT